MATLNLPDDTYTLVWRVIKAQVQADAAYDAAGVAVVFYDGDRESTKDLPSFQGPALKLFPVEGPMAWFDEGSTEGALVVMVEGVLTVLDCEDVLNLQGALVSTLNSVGNTTFQQDLVAAGAVDGLVLCGQPLRPSARTTGQDGLFLVSGQFAVAVRRPLLS